MIYGTRSNGKEHGVVFTKKEVVETMLDLVGYLPSKNLSKLRIIDPAAGNGAFALSIINRLYQSSLNFGFNFERAINNIQLCEIDSQSIVQLRANIDSSLKEYKVSIPEDLITHGDFLLKKMKACDIIVGNPPYVRHENIPEHQKTKYKAVYRTFRHRSDLYILFFEKGLSLLKKDAKLCYICSNRWLKNQYGESLRKLVSSAYHLSHIIDLENTNPFQETVIAYPAITLISNSTPNTFCNFYEIDDLALLSRSFIQDKTANIKLNLLSSNWFTPFPLDTANYLKLASIVNQGFKIGIGVATGCDRVFIKKDLTLFESDSRDS